MLTSLLRKSNPTIPIIVISAYEDKELLKSFMSLRLIEYLVKPIDFNQLNEILIKCAREIERNGLIETRLSKNALYSHSKKSLIVDENIITLTPKEIEFLELLIKNKNRLVTKIQIEDYLYAGEDMSSAAINNLSSKLRKKIGSNNSIITVSNIGFMMVNQS